MQVNLQQLRGGNLQEQVSLDFTHSLDLSHVKLWGEAVFRQPVEIAGTVRSAAGVVSVEYTATYTLCASCARCLAPVMRQQAPAFVHVIVEEVAEELSADEYVVAPNGILDVDELVTSDILLQLDGVVLCTEECRGLCPKCGANLNLEPCGCSAHEPDPRFDALRKLLDEQ